MPSRVPGRLLIAGLPLLTHCVSGSSVDPSPPTDAAPFEDGVAGDAATDTTVSSMDAAETAIADAAACTKEWTLTEYYNGHVINGLATNGKIYVAVGECGVDTPGVDCGAPVEYGGLVMTSSGALTDWRVGQSQVMLSLKDVTYAGGRFVAVGNKKHITTSEDGLVWTKRLAGVPTDPTLTGIVHDGKRFVVVGTSGAVCTSDEGVIWSCETIAGGPHFSAIAHCGGRFVGVGASGMIATSTDAKTWTTAKVGTANLYAVGCGGGRFVAGGAGGASWYSDDGSKWTPTASKATNYWHGLTYLAPCGMFVAALDWGTGPTTSILVSRDGVEWEQRFTGSTAKHALFGVLFDGARAITYGAYSAVHVSPCPCGG